MHTNTSASRNLNGVRARHAAVEPSRRLRYKHLAFGVGLALGSLLVCGVAAAASGIAANASPTGGEVVGGVGSITHSGASTIVSQQSKLLSLNWQTFNVGKNASVLFKQPGVSAIALNRILDQNPSQIFGKISSNGQIFLINTHGIIFGASARLNVGGLVASTLDLTPPDFLAQHFNLDAHGGSASVVNHGTIAAASGGSVSLIGGQVENDGLIVANYGHINLDGADQAVLNFDGDGLINVAITGALKQRLDADQAAVVNKGTLRADSGSVVLQASAAKNLFTNLVNNSGVIDAHGISKSGGVVRLVGSGGNVIDSGSINVSGTQGGSAQLLSDQNVGMSGSITADAMQDGAGGNILVKGDDSANISGTLTARGGAQGGNGGFVETSGDHVHIGDSTRVNTLAPFGKAGTWLIDPEDFTIAASGGDITGATLSGNLASGDVAIESSAGTHNAGGTGSINVDDAVSWGSATTPHTLTLTAANNININAVMTVNGGGLVLNPATANGTGAGAESAVTTGTVNVMPGVGVVNFTGTGNTLSIGGTPYTIITSLGAAGSTTDTDLQGINGGLTGHYALGADINATLTSGWNSGAGFTPLGNGTTAFSGVFNGLGHTISNLTVAGTNAYAGLFGQLSGSVSNVALLGGVVSSASSAYDVYVGALAGKNDAGTITNVYATGAVSSTNSGAIVGGLVGSNLNGTIQDAFATGAVSGGIYTGGLVGLNNGSTITDAYATGAVTGNDGGTGGLVGGNAGTITRAYATGAVSGGAVGEIGGLVGLNSGGTVVDGYWDTQTSGQATSPGGGTGMTTADLQSVLPTGFAAPTWGVVAGAYPYLLSQFAPGATPEVVSGTLYTDAGVTAAGAGVTVTGLSNNGTDVLSTQTGVNGYYYSLVNPGSITSNSLLLYAQNYGSGSNINGAAFTDDGTAFSNLDIFGNTFNIQTSNTAWSVVMANLAGAEGGGATSVNALTLLPVSGLTTLNMVATGDMDIDSGLTWSGDLDLTTGGAITQTATGNVVVTGTTSFDTGTSNITLANAGNSFGGLITVNGAGAVELNGTGTLDMGAVASTGSLTLDTASTLNGNVTTSSTQTYNGAVALGANVTLATTNSAVTFGNTVANAVSGTPEGLKINAGSGAVNFDGAVGSGSDLLGALEIDGTGATKFASTVHAASLVTNTGTTTLDGSVTTGTAQTYNGAVALGGNVTLTTTNSAVTFGSTVNNAVSGAANTLTVKAGSGLVNFDGAVGSAGDALGALVIDGTGATTFASTVDAASLATNTGTTTLDGNVTTSGGTQTYNGATALGSSLTLTGSQVTLQNVSGNNHDLAVTGNVELDGALTGVNNLSISGTTALGIATITTAGSQTYTGDVTLDNDAVLTSTAGSVSFGGKVDSQNATAHSLEVDATTGLVSFGGAVGGTHQLNDFTINSNTLTAPSALSVAGDLSITTVAALTTGSAWSGANVTLASNGNLTLGGDVTATAANGTVKLTSGGGNISQSAGAINANTLTGSSTGSTTLGSATNAITNLGDFTAVGFSLTNAQALDVTGMVNGDTGTTALTTTGAGNDLTIDSTGSVAGADVGLTSGSSLAIGGTVSSGAGTTTLTQTGTGAISETGGSITAAKLTGSSTGDTTLGGSNQIGELDAFSAKDLTLLDASNLNVVGPISTAGGTGNISFTTTAGHSLTVGQILAGGAITLISGSDLDVSNAVTGSAVTLGADGNLTINAAVNSGAGTTKLTQTGTGSISEGTGSIVAARLTGSSTGDTMLTGNNQIGELDAFSAKNLTLVDAGNLNVVGPITTTGGTGNISLTTTAGHALSVGQMSTGGTLTLDSGSNLTVAQNVAGSAVTLGANGTLAINATVNSGTGTTTLNQIGTGAITEDTTNGQIIAGKLTGSSTGDTTLGGNNQIGELDAFSAKDLTLLDASNLHVVGPISTTGGTGNISLTTTSGNALTVGQALTGGAITLDSGSDLTVAQNVTGSAVNLGANGNLAINAAVSSGTGTTTLTQTGAGAITEDTTNGQITAAKLTGSSAGDTTLDSNGNQIAELDAFSAKDLALVDNANLNVAGPITTTGGTGNISFTTTAGHTLTVGQVLTGGGITLDSGSDLDVVNAITGSAVNLAANGNLAIDAAVSSGAGTTTLTQTGTGSISESGGSITAGHLTGSSTGDTTLASNNNQIGELDAFSAKDLTLVDASNLNVVGPISTTGNTGNISFTTTAGHTLTIGQTLTGGAITLDSGSDLTVAQNVTGSAVNLGANGNLAINAAVSSGAAGTTTLTQTGTGSITESGGSITAGHLTGSSTGDTTLGGNNQIGEVDAFSAQGLTLVDAHDLSVVGPITTTGGAGNISFTTLPGYTLDVGQVLTGGAITLDSGSDLDVVNAITGSAVTLGANGNLLINAAVNSGTGTTTLNQLGTGAISENGNGVITAGTLTGGSTGATTLGNANNKIANLGSFSASGFTLTDSRALTVLANDTVNGNGVVNLTTTGGGSDLTINGRVEGTQTKLTSAGAINEGAGGVVQAATLTGSSVGATHLVGTNAVVSLGNFTAAGFALSNGQALTVANGATVDGGSGASLTTTGASSDLTLNGTVSGTNTSLVSSSGIGEGSNGAIIANNLTGSAAAAATLTGTNQVANLGNFSADGLTFNDGTALTIASGALVNGGSATRITTTGSGSDLTINGALAGTTTQLVSAGAINEGASGKIQAGTLTGSAAHGAQLTGTNAIATLGNFSAQGLALTNGQALTIAHGATVDGGASTTLTTTGANGNLAIDGTLKGATTTLLASGSISEDANGTLAAGTLTGSSVGATSLTGHNNVANLGNFTANGFSLTTGSNLTVVAGNTVAGGANTTLTTTGSGHDLAIDGSVQGDTTKLVATGAINEGSGGHIVASTLTGSSVGDTTLKSANQIAALGAFNAKNFYLTDAHALAVGGPLTTTGSAGNISLVTTGGTGNTLTVNQAVHGAQIAMTSAGALTVANAVYGTQVDLASNGNLAINALVDSGTGTVTLTQNGAGSITGDANGDITAGTLTGTAVGATSLGSAGQFMGNHVGVLGGFSSPAGFSFTNDGTLTLASVNGSAYTIDAGQAPLYLAVQNGDLLQNGSNWLYDGVGTWASTGHIGLSNAPIYVMGVSNQTVASIGLPPAYFYAIDSNGNLLSTGPNSVNVPTAILSSDSQGVNGHTDHYIDISVITANYRSYGVVAPGLLLPPDQLECPPDQASSSSQCPENH